MPAVVFNTKVSEKEESFKLKDNVNTKVNENKLSTDQFRGEITRSLKARKLLFWNRFRAKRPRTDCGHFSHGTQPAQERMVGAFAYDRRDWTLWPGPSFPYHWENNV